MTEEISTIQQILDGIPSLTDPVERASALEQAEQRLKGAEGTKRSFKMETRLIQDVQKRRQLEGRLQRMEQELRTLKADLKALQADQQRGELFIQGGGNDGGEGGMDPTKAGDNMLKEAQAIQEKTADSLGNTKNMIAQSKEVGIATLEELQRQREVIQNIERETDRLDDNLARAEALIKQFGKRMASDSFIQCFAVVNCLLLLGVVLYAIFRDGSLTKEESPPQEPIVRMLRG